MGRLWVLSEFLSKKIAIKDSAQNMTLTTDIYIQSDKHLYRGLPPGWPSNDSESIEQSDSDGYCYSSDRDSIIEGLQNLWVVEAVESAVHNVQCDAVLSGVRNIHTRRLDGTD